MRLFEKLLVSGEKRFALLVIEGLRRAGESRPIQFEKDRFRLMVGGNAFPLAGFYQEYRTGSQQIRSGVVRRAVQSWRVESPPRAPAAISLDRLLPIVLPRGVLELLELGTAGDEIAWPHKVMGEHLAAAIALPPLANAKPLSRDELTKAGIDFENGWDAACESLRRRGAKSEWRQIGPSFFACESDDGTAAAQMLLPEGLAELPLVGEPIVIPAAADRLLAAGSDVPDALVKLAQHARGEFQHARAISGIAFRWTGGEWSPWLPPCGHSAYGALKLLQMETLARDYAQQKRFLEELGRKAGEPICLASYSAVEDEHTGEPLSYTVWPEGLEILLPEADQIVFFQPDATGESGRVVARAPWARVERELAGVIEPLGCYPPRWLVRDFPDTARLRALTS
jgi:hypothetical protein